MNKIWVGCQTITWSADKNKNNMASVLEDISNCNYQGVEIGARHLDLGQPKIMRKLLNEKGLKLVALHVGGQFMSSESQKNDWRNLEKIVRYGKELNCLYIVVSGISGENKPENRLQMEADRLNEAGAKCEHSGLRLCYHNHWWEIQNKAEELHYLCEHTDPNLVYLCPDVGWIKKGGNSPKILIENFIDRIEYIHFKDVKGEKWVEIGQGTIDFLSLLDILTKRERIWIIVEQDTTDKTPYESAKISREYLRQRLGI